MRLVIFLGNLWRIVQYLPKATDERLSNKYTGRMGGNGGGGIQFITDYVYIITTVVIQIMATQERKYLFLRVLLYMLHVPQFLLMLLIQSLEFYPSPPPPRQILVVSFSSLHPLTHRRLFQITPPFVDRIISYTLSKKQV